MPEIIPAFLVHSQDEFERKLRLVENECQTIQVDILDGTLFPNTTWYDPKAIGNLRTDIKYELHLMVNNPIPIINEWQKYVPNLQRVIIHAEINRPIGAVIEYIKEFNKLEVGLALNPATPLSEVHHALFRIDQITLLGVHPGFSGQKFISELIMPKITDLKKIQPKLLIEVDGGINDELIKPLIKAGVNRLCTASLIFNDPNPLQKIQTLKKVLSTK